MPTSDFHMSPHDQAKFGFMVGDMARDGEGRRVRIRRMYFNEAGYPLASIRVLDPPMDTVVRIDSLGRDDPAPPNLLEDLEEPIQGVLW